MGGKVFDRPAARLINAQFSRLETYCHRILRPFFQDILTNRHLGEKETHGDIDLLCAWDGVDVGTYIRGQDRGRVLEEADGAATQPTGEEDQGASVKRLFEGTQFTAWIECIARNFKAEEWTRLGTEVHILAFKLPFATWDEVGRDNEAGDGPSPSASHSNHMGLRWEEEGSKHPDPVNMPLVVYDWWLTHNLDFLSSRPGPHPSRRIGIQPLYVLLRPNPHHPLQRHPFPVPLAHPGGDAPGDRPSRLRRCSSSASVPHIGRDRAVRVVGTGPGKVAVRVR